MDATTKRITPEEAAEQRARNLTGLLWHAGTYLIINTFFVILDLAGAGGVNWSIWIILGWGFGLAFHALWYFIDGSRLEERKTQKYLAESTHDHDPTHAQDRSTDG